MVINYHLSFKTKCAFSRDTNPWFIWLCQKRYTLFHLMHLYSHFQVMKSWSSPTNPKKHYDMPKKYLDSLRLEMKAKTVNSSCLTTLGRTFRWSTVTPCGRSWFLLHESWGPESLHILYIACLKKVTMTAANRKMRMCCFLSLLFLSHTSMTC